MYDPALALEQLTEIRTTLAQQERELIRMSKKSNPLGFRASVKRVFRIKRFNKQG